MFRPLRPGQLAFDIAAPAGLFLLCLFPFAMTGLGWVGVLFGMCLALVFRRLAPGIALGIAWLTAILQMATGQMPNPANLAILAILYATAAYGTPLVRWLGLASVPVGAIAITAYVTVVPAMFEGVGYRFNPWIPSYRLEALFRYGTVVFIVTLIGFGLAWTLGLLVRTATRGRESRREAVIAQQEVAAEQERTRIARDMHDVVAHSLAIVVAQADGARYLGKKDPEATEQALAAIATTAREALSDVRVLLAQLRYSQVDGPQPTLVDLERLVEQVRASGLTVSQETSGDPLPLGTAQQLAVYRIVQESLTNALRHADTSEEVVVRFTWSPHGLELTITSALADEKPKSPYGPGHGIAGMTERALLVGGWLTAVPDEHHFVVRAWLPAHPEAVLTPSAELAS
jgi:signal transduction histidine kinase